MKYITDASLTHKTILLRVDFNVSLDPKHHIANDERIRQSIPTIEYLLKHHNKLIILAHLGEPKERDEKYSLAPVAKRLQEYVPEKKVILVNDFLTDKKPLETQTENEIILLENIRFYQGETSNDPDLAKKLASLADVYVNDAFGVCHRKQTSVVGIPQFLPSYGGLLLKKEITMLDKVVDHPEKPYVAIIGGMKISTKIQFIKKLTMIADHVILGGGLANTFLMAQGYLKHSKDISLSDITLAKDLLALAKRHNTQIILPKDVITAKTRESDVSEMKKITELQKDDGIFDIGSETEADFGAIIAKAKTIIWNGPVGYIENPLFKRGTDFLYYAITENNQATSVVGGGDTLVALTNKEYLDKITHISTGGGAMLEFIENGTLPGIEALK